MDHDVILNKIQSLEKCINRLIDKNPGNLDTLINDIDLQDIISVNLERAVQISIDISSMIISKNNYQVATHMSESFEILEKHKVIPKILSEKLQKAVGYRNISVHEYEKIDWSIVLDIISNHLINFKEFTKSILNNIQ